MTLIWICAEQLVEKKHFIDGSFRGATFWYVSQAVDLILRILQWFAIIQLSETTSSTLIFQDFQGYSIKSIDSTSAFTYENWSFHPPGCFSLIIDISSIADDVVSYLHCSLHLTRRFCGYSEGGHAKIPPKVVPSRCEGRQRIHPCWDKYLPRIDTCIHYYLHIIYIIYIYTVFSLNKSRLYLSIHRYITHLSPISISSIFVVQNFAP